MNEWFPESYSAVQKANVDAFYGYANVAFEGLQKLTALNLQAARAVWADTQVTAQAALSATDAQALLTQQSTRSAVAAERILSYNRALYDIALTTHTGFATLAGARYEAYNERMQTLVESLSKQVPAGSEAAASALKKVFASSNALYDSVNKTVRQAVHMAEGSLEAVLPRQSDASDTGAG
jgi:phasin family protein